MMLVLPYPPSVNRMWRTPRSGALAGRTLLSEEGRNYRKAVSGISIGHRMNPAIRLSVTIEARMPDRRKRDLDNLPKAILDALTHCGVWADDSHIDDLRIWRGPVQKGGAVIVTIAKCDAQR